MSNRIMLVLVLNKINYLDDLLVALSDRGIPSATVLTSKGMNQKLSRMEDSQIISTLRPIILSNHSDSKTLFMILDEEQTMVAREVIHEVIGDLSKPETGILFGLPTLFTDGIRSIDDK